MLEVENRLLQYASGSLAEIIDISPVSVIYDQQYIL